MVPSLPSWERGLKLMIRQISIPLVIVAPFVGAWIETLNLPVQFSFNFVAPFVGAWIETERRAEMERITTVAPFVGAWIET